MFSDNFVLTEKTKTKTKTGVRPYEKKAPGISFFSSGWDPKKQYTENKSKSGGRLDFDLLTTLVIWQRQLNSSFKEHRQRPTNYFYILFSYLMSVIQNWSGIWEIKQQKYTPTSITHNKNEHSGNTSRRVQDT